ncbi:C40 family peptidase [Cellulomonas cellasea]|uniref:C40 family peptidase n=1 Tax=Cellulomonas cellasea TaxID=43670 RepID=UPI0025A3E654|nr:C40 family peptidase [Cellulomonas cellasea]MDM8083513.1 C40 family peptidase [Cellulomonas cellasea]
MSTQRTTPRRHRPLVALLGVGLLVMGPSVPAMAEPTAPSDKDVRDARAAVAGAARSVAAIEVRLAQQSVEREAAEVAVQAAGEAYTRAEVDRETAAASAQIAAERYEQANEEAEHARRTLVAVARQAARSGGSMDGVQAFLSAEGFEELVERSNAIARVGARSDEAVQSYLATQLVATALKARSDDAYAEQEDKTRAAKDALATAEQTHADAEAALAAADAEREALIAELAVARDTSAAVETARQNQLDLERRQRAEAAAEAERRPSAPTGGSGATTPGGGSSGGSAPGSPGTSVPVTPPTAVDPIVPPVTTPTAPPVTTPTPPPATSTPGGQYGLGTGTTRGSAAQGAAAVAWAVARVGTPYLWGGVGPDGYDCSGLTMKAWRDAGVNLNRTSRDQYKQVRKIAYDEMRPGDLVFWGSNVNDPDSITHVAMWMGNNQIVEAPRAGVPVRVTSMRWSGTMTYAGRP